MTTTFTEEAHRVDLAALVAQLEALQARKADAVVSAERIRSERGVLYVKGMGAERMTFGLDSDTEGAYAPSDAMVGHIGARLGVPVQYLRKVQAERPYLFDGNVNGWLHGDGGVHGPDARKFLVRGYSDSYGPGTGRALLSDGYKPMENLDALTAALLGIRESGKAVDVVEASLSPSRMYVRFASPELMAQAPNLLRGYRTPVQPRFNPGGRPQVGDVFAGFEVGNSEIGHGALYVVPKLTMLLCTNGMTINVLNGQQLGIRLIHSGGRLDEGLLVMSSDTQAKILAAVQAQVRDAVVQFLDPEFLAEVIASIESKAGRELDHPVDTIETVARTLGFSDDTRAGVLDHFIRGGQVTAGGVLNAVTSFAQTVSDADLANELEALAIQALELAASDRPTVGAAVRAEVREAALALP